MGREHPGVPKGKAQRNFTDPDSRIMPTGKDFVQGYNTQVAVDSAHQVIVVRENTREIPKELSADAGYFSTKGVKVLAARKVKVFITPNKIRHASPGPPAPRGRIPKGMSLIDRMRRKMQTKVRKQRYVLRIKHSIHTIALVDTYRFSTNSLDKRTWKACHI